MAVHLPERKIELIMADFLRATEDATIAALPIHLRFRPESLKTPCLLIFSDRTEPHAPRAASWSGAWRVSLTLRVISQHERAVDHDEIVASLSDLLMRDALTDDLNTYGRERGIAVMTYIAGARSWRIEDDKLVTDLEFEFLVHDLE